MLFSHPPQLLIPFALVPSIFSGIHQSRSPVTPPHSNFIFINSPIHSSVHAPKAKVNGIRDQGSGITAPGAGIREPGSGIWDVGSQGMGSGITLCHVFGIRDKNFGPKIGITDEKNIPPSLRPWTKNLCQLEQLLSLKVINLLISYI